MRATSDHIAPLVPCERSGALRYSLIRETDERKTNLVEHYGEEYLESQQDHPGDQISMRGGPSHKRGGILERKNDESEEDGYNLNDGRFDHNGDKERILFRWSRRKERKRLNKDEERVKDGDTLYATRVTPDSADKVPKELAIEEPKVACPNRIYIGVVS